MCVRVFVSVVARSQSMCVVCSWVHDLLTINVSWMIGYYSGSVHMNSCD